MQAYKKDEESGVGQFFQDKTVSRHSQHLLSYALASNGARVLARSSSTSRDES